MAVTTVPRREPPKKKNHGYLHAKGRQGFMPCIAFNFISIPTTPGIVFKVDDTHAHHPFGILVISRKEALL